MDNKFSSNLETLFGNLDSFISTKTVVGEPIHIGDVIMLPLIDVFFGLGAGGGTSDTEKKEPANKDLAALGAKISPSAVIVIKDGTVQLVNVKNQDAISKLIDMAPGVLSKFNFNGFEGKKSDTPGKETVKTETVTETVVVEGGEE